LIGDEEEEHEPTNGDSDWKPSSEDKDNEDVYVLLQGTRRFVKTKKELHGATLRSVVPTNTGPIWLCKTWMRKGRSCFENCIFLSDVGTARRL